MVSTDAAGRRRAAPAASWYLAGLLLCLAPVPVSAQLTGRLVDFVEVSPTDRHVDVLVQFNCSIRYLAHTPADFGSSAVIRLRPGADCGSTIRPEQAPVSGAGDLIRSAAVDESAPGEAALTLSFARPLPFVLAPTSSGRGLRVRLLDANATRGKVSIVEREGQGGGFAINLDSSTSPFDEAAVRAAGERLRMVAYVSTLELEGKIWYRLRVGPIARRKDAERILAAAQQSYPRAWLAIDDEPAPPPGPDPLVSDVSPTTPVDPPLPDAERRTLMAAGRAALARREYSRAAEVFTKLTRQPEYAERARAQELLGLTRERAGQLAHAKAEYGEYLRRYPEGEAAARIRARLRTLASAGRRGRPGSGTGARDEEGAWRLNGGASQMYRWDRSSVTTAEVATAQQNQNAIYTDGDFTARRRGERYDFIGRVAAGYAKDLLTGGPGDQTRVATAFIELNDRQLGWATRLGRQTRNSGGLLGTFDGLFASYRIRSGLALNAALGYPVESTRETPGTDRRFLGVAADFGPLRDRWDITAFAVAQTLAGQTDRRAIGLEGRYFVPGRTLVALLDYDVYFRELNSLVLMGNLQLPARWVVSFNADHRRSPALTMRNALIGQSVSGLGELLTLFGPDEVRILAQDRTPVSDTWSLSVGRPLGERFQLSFDAFATRADATLASGGVPGTPAAGLDRTLQLQLSGSSLLRSSDLWVFAARQQASDTSTMQSLSIATRIPIGSGAWRVGPRLRVDRRERAIDDSREWLYVPTLRIDYQRGASWFELEAGAEIGDRDLLADTERTRRHYLSVGYRVNFR